MTEEWEIVAYRLQKWKTFTHAPLCTFCRARNVNYESTKPDIRITPVGDCCISCWLDREACGVCGVGPVVQGWSHDRPLEFRGVHICSDCLVPEIPAAAWRDWLLYFVYTPQSSFVQVLDHAFAEDFRRLAEPQERRREWPLTTVLAS